MDRARNRSLIAQLEGEARQAPQTVRQHMFALIALGYGYVFAIIGLLLALAALVVWVLMESRSVGWIGKIVIALLALIWVILRSLWVTIEPPAGRALALDRVPRLKARVEELRRALRSPRPDHVLLTEDFNAAVMQVPRLGIFGWPSTYLILGLPLMQSLTPAEFDAVLAHEFAHLSGAHPKRGLWVHRMARTWEQLMTALDASESWGAVFFRPFVRWYIPRLDAYGFVMSRQDEYAADRDAAQATSATTMSSALVALHARDVFGHTFWTGIWERVAHDAEPPAVSWSALPDRVRAGSEGAAPRERVQRALVAPPSEFDTHPTLRDRLRALGTVPDDEMPPVDAALGLLSPLADTAADHYLGELAETRLHELDRSWRSEVRETWQQQHSEVQGALRLRAKLEAQERDEGELDIAALAELAYLTARFDGDAAALPIAWRVLARDDTQPVMHFMVGRMLLGADDPAGVAHLERAMTLDVQAIAPAAELLRTFHAGRGDAEAIGRLDARLDELDEMLQEAQAERMNVGPDDEYVRVELDAADHTMLMRVLRRFDRVRQLHVVRHVTRHGQEVPHLVLLAELRTFPPSFDNPAELAQSMLGHIRLSRKSDVTLFISGRRTRWLRKVMRRVDAVRVEQ